MRFHIRKHLFEVLSPAKISIVLLILSLYIRLMWNIYPFMVNADNTHKLAPTNIQRLH